MGNSVESRFERYADVMVEALGHADRAAPARWYLRGLMLPGQRKSVEPMAARVHPQDVRSAHQSMHHLVAHSEWSDAALLAQVAREVVPVLSEAEQVPCFWIIDDTGFRKYGQHSVGVARQYCGQLGKTDNCQVAVSLSLATVEGSVPLDYRLYLPREWAEDKPRRKLAGVPKEIAFATKGELAWTQTLGGAWLPGSRVARCSWMPAMAMRRRCAIGSVHTACSTRRVYGRRQRFGGMSTNLRRLSKHGGGGAP